MNIRKGISFFLGAVLISIVFVGVPLFLIFLNRFLGLPIYTNTFFKIIGTVFIGSGLGVVVYSMVQHLKTGRITPLPVIEPPKQFIATGLYKYCRNPMYLSWMFIYLGIFLVLGYFLLFLFSIVVFLGFHIFVIYVEEPELYKIFGEQYKKYTKTVPRWMPNIGKKPINTGWRGDEPTEIVIKSFKEGIIKPGDKVLDIGCGFGRNANWLASKGMVVTAININHQEIKESKAKAKKLGVAVNYLNADAVALPLPDCSFDVALDLGCTHMISDINSQKKAETEVARVLKPGGRLIYFGFSKKHPDYLNKPNGPMFRNVEDIQTMYGNDFNILSSKENRWQPKPEENRNFSEHVGLEIILKRKG